MEKFKYYKELIGAIILAGLMILVALRISDIASGIDALITAFVPLIVGACIAFVLDILVVRYERWLWPRIKSGWRYKIRRPLSIILYCPYGCAAVSAFHYTYRVRSTAAISRLSTLDLSFK